MKHIENMKIPNILSVCSPFWWDIAGEARKELDR